MMMNPSSLLAFARERLTSILHLGHWSGALPKPDAQPALSHLVPATLWLIRGASPAYCMAAYDEASQRGPQGGVAFTINWSKLLPFEDHHAVARHQAKVVKHARDHRRPRLPNAYIISSLEQSEQFGMQGHFFVQADLDAQAALMDNIEAWLVRLYGPLPLHTFMRGAAALPFCHSNGRAPSAAIGVDWVKYCLKGCVELDSDLSIHRKLGVIDVQAVTIKWGCGRMLGKSRFDGQLTARRADQGT